MVFLVVLIVSILLSVIYYKQLKLHIIQVKYGKYSYAYIKQFKKFANKSPFPYCFKDDILPYLRLSLFKKDEVNIFASEKNLLFDGRKFHCQINEIIKDFGTPDCFNAFIIKGMELKAFGYSSEESGIRLNKIFFFTDNEFFMGEYHIDELNTYDSINIADKILEKFGIKEKNHATHFFVEDKNKNEILFYENGFSILIRFVNNSDAKFLELIK